MTTDPVHTIFEIHITCDLIDPTAADEERFRQLCVSEGLKPIFVGILYEHGRGYRRLMQTSKYVTGTYEVAVDCMFFCANMVRYGGFDVLRTKIEMLAGCWDEGHAALPVTKAEAAFFETHIVVSHPDSSERSQKLSALQGLNRELLAEWRQTRGRHVPLSFNLRKPEECFVTLRAPTALGPEARSSRESARAQEDAAIERLTTLGFPVIKSIREVTVYDSNPDVDSEEAWDQ